MKLGKYWLRPEGIACKFVHLFVGCSMGLFFGAIVAVGMNVIHPLF